VATGILISCKTEHNSKNCKIFLYNLISTVKSPSRVTNNTSSLIDVMKLNTTEVLDLGYSGNLEQILHIHIDNPKTRPVIVNKRQFTEKSTQEFKYLLHNELWKDMFLCDDVNTSFNAFMSTIVHYFKRAFPLKIIYVKDQHENKWKKNRKYTL